MTENIQYTVYQEETFRLWGLAHHDGRDEPAFNTEEEALLIAKHIAVSKATGRDKERIKAREPDKAVKYFNRYAWGESLTIVKTRLH